MNVLMTGATGYLGRRLIQHLDSANHRVVALKRLSSTLPESAEALPNVRWHDIEYSSVSHILNHYGHMDVIVHLATDYGRSEGGAIQPFNVNVALPMSLIEGVLESGAVTVINTDTFFSAMDNYDYLRPYILSKRQFLAWGKLLAEEMPLRFVNCRVFHMYGPGDSEEKFMNRLVRQCLQHVPEIALTSGTQRRDFVYVDDVVDALVTVLNHLTAGGDGFVHYELGTGEGTSIRSLVEQVHRLARSRSVLAFGALADRVGEPDEIVADPTSLQALGWAPKVALEQGIQAVIAAS